jgi:ribosome-interacting GTPase 1
MHVPLNSTFFHNDNIFVIFQGAKIQLLDLPGIIEGAKDGKGRGRQVNCLYYLSSSYFKLA